MMIGIDASRANRPHKSGTEWYAFYLIKALAKIDSRNQYILYTDKPLTYDLLDLCELPEEAAPERKPITVNKDGYQAIRCPHNNFRAKVLGWPFDFFWTQGRLSLEMLFHRPDVLFIPSHTLPLIHPKRSVVTIHDVGFERDKRLYLERKMGPAGKKWRPAIDWLVRIFTGGRYGANTTDYNSWSTIFALKNARGIITVSDFSKTEILELYKNTRGVPRDLIKKIAAIHNGYNDCLFKKITDREKTAAILKKYNITAPYVFYVGRLERKKNTPNLVEAFAIFLTKNKNLPHRLVLAGAASFGYDEVKYMTQEYDLEDRVIKPGWVAEADLPYLFSAADVFIFPSLYEGFGIPLLEAMACEVPIAASDRAAIPEVVGEAAEKFDPLDANSVARALENVIGDRRRREELVQKGRERVKAFSWEKCAAETLKVIENL